MKHLILLISILLPGLALAQGQSSLGTLLGSISRLINIIIPIVFALALLYFFWGVAMYINKAGESSTEEGRKKMVWGVLALFVAGSIWGITYFIGDALNIEVDTLRGVDDGTDPEVPADIRFDRYDDLNNDPFNGGQMDA